jgi:hypothetical protein
LYTGATHENEKWSFGSYLYSENDIKPTLQQNLTEEQAQILLRGDNPELMVAPSAYLDSYSDNKLYKKLLLTQLKFLNIPMTHKRLFNVQF